MKFDLKRMFEAIDASNGPEDPGKGPGKPTTPAEIKAYQDKLAEKGLGWDPKTNRIYNLVGGKSGTDMQNKSFNDFDLKTYQNPTEMNMAWDNRSDVKGVDRKNLGLDMPPAPEKSNEELFEYGYWRSPQYDNLVELKPGQKVEIDGKSYTFNKKGEKIGSRKK